MAQQAGLAVSPNRHLTVGFDLRRRPFMQRKSRRLRRKQALDLIEHRLRRVGAMLAAEEQQASAAVLDLDDVGSRVVDRRVLGEAEDVALGPHQRWPRRNSMVWANPAS